MVKHTKQDLYASDDDAGGQAPVECLGMTFPNDEARRAHFIEALRAKMQDPAFRSIEGFPIGDVEDILALSDPPYYTACPNPFLSTYLSQAITNRPSSTKTYRRLPYPLSLSDSRNNAFVNAHSYATKVPHESVMRLVLHYTDPGDIVLDGFVGTGMTAVAVQLCADVEAVRSLGYTVDRKSLEAADERGTVVGRVGGRYAIVSDLGPAATHLSYNFNFPFDDAAFEREVDQIAAAVEEECGWMYKTRHGSKGVGTVICVLWSDVFICGNCGKEIVFWEAAVDLKNNEISDSVQCPHCKGTSRKGGMSIAWTTRLEPTGQPVRSFKQVPVMVIYEVEGRRFEKTPDLEDLQLISRIEAGTIPYFYPTEAMPYGYNTEQPRKSHGLTHLHDFFTKRNLWALACAWSHARSHRAKFMLTSLMYKSSVLCAPLMSNYFASRRGENRGGWIGKERSGTLYCPSIRSEVSIASQIVTRRRAVKVNASSTTPPIIGTASATQTGLPDDCVDYIFTDPPFGGNKMYSELAFMWEAWLRVFTNNGPEAIQNKAQKKGLPEYEFWMTKAFAEYYRVLKPGRWITVEFSNTEAAVWNALQNALGKAGFVIADVRDLHKQQGSILGYTTTVASRQDLAISAYKADVGLETTFRLKPTDENSVWSFVRSHLQHVQVTDTNGDRMSVISERQGYVLFDRLVAFNVQRGYPVPMSSPEFHAGLRERFPERDQMYFLPEQVSEYDKKRLESDLLQQLTLFVSDEKSAIQWVRQTLSAGGMTYQELQPLYMKEAQRVWDKHEQPVELQTILDQNFVDDSDGKWHVPDASREEDLERLRHRTLMKEFQQYVDVKGKLKVLRIEALRVGFRESWQTKNYTTIVEMAKRVPEAVIQEDPALLMYFDNASLMLGL